MLKKISIQLGLLVLFSFSLTTISGKYDEKDVEYIHNEYLNSYKKYIGDGDTIALQNNLHKISQKRKEIIDDFGRHNFGELYAKCKENLGVVDIQVDDVDESSARDNDFQKEYFESQLKFESVEFSNVARRLHQSAHSINMSIQQIQFAKSELIYNETLKNLALYLKDTDDKNEFLASLEELSKNLEKLASSKQLSSPGNEEKFIDQVAKYISALDEIALKLGLL